MGRKPKELVFKSRVKGKSLVKAEWPFGVDNLIRSLTNFGFQQILLPPVEEKDMFLKHPELENFFGPQILEVSGQVLENLVLPPTFFLSVLKRYLRSLKAYGPHVAKWFYLSPVLKIEGEKTELRHELGIFVLGENSTLAYAQLISTIVQVLNYLGVSDFLVEINSWGCKKCQKDYQNLLQDHLSPIERELCPDCHTNFAENPIEIWHCPNASCQTLIANIPPVVDFLDDSCRAFFISVLEAIDELGIPYILNPGLCDRFAKEKILFRINIDRDPQPKVILGSGGNYAHWAEHLGEETAVPALGFLASLEKLWQLIPEEKRSSGNRAEVFIMPLGEVAARRALSLYRELQQAGILVGEAMLGNTGIRDQLKEAQLQHAEIALIIGQKEAIDETVILRDMRSGMQEVFMSDRIIEEVRKRLGR